MSQLYLCALIINCPTMLCAQGSSSSSRRRPSTSSKSPDAAAARYHNVLPDFRKPKVTSKDGVYYPLQVGMASAPPPRRSKTENFPWRQMVESEAKASNNNNHHAASPANGRSMRKLGSLETMGPLGPLAALGPSLSASDGGGGGGGGGAGSLRAPALVVEPGASKHVVRLKQRLGSRTVAFGDEELPPDDAPEFKQLGYSVPATWFPQRNKMPPAAQFDLESHVHPWHEHQQPRGSPTSQKKSKQIGRPEHLQQQQRQQRIAQIFGSSGGTGAAGAGAEVGAGAGEDRALSTAGGGPGRRLQRASSRRLEPLKPGAATAAAHERRPSTTDDAPVNRDAPTIMFPPPPRAGKLERRSSLERARTTTAFDKTLTAYNNRMNSNNVRQQRQQGVDASSSSAVGSIALQASKHRMAKFRGEIQRHQAKITAIDAKQNDRIRTLMDTMPLSFLLNYSVDAECVAALPACLPACRSTLPPHFGVCLPAIVVLAATHSFCCGA